MSSRKKIDEGSEYEEVLKDPLFDVSGAPSQAPERMPRSGMLGTEAVKLASQWWDKVGAPLARKQNKKINYDPVKQDVAMVSGIIFGLPWSQLNQRERFRVVKCWHDTFCKQLKGTLKDDRIPEKRRTVAVAKTAIN